MQNSKPFSPKRPYKPIDCSFHDVLLAKATRKEKCRFAFEVSAEHPLHVEGKIVDVYTKAGEEFMQLDNGQTFRLDSLKQLDGLLAPWAKN